MVRYFCCTWTGFCYHPNAIKTHLIVKEQFFDKAKRLFEGTNVNITVQGK